MNPEQKIKCDMCGISIPDIPEDSTYDERLCNKCSQYPKDDTERARVKIQEEIEKSTKELERLSKLSVSYYIKQAYIEGLEFALDEIGI